MFNWFAHEVVCTLFIGDVCKFKSLVMLTVLGSTNSIFDLSF